MVIGLNLGTKSAQILNKKVATFNSPHVDGLKIVNTRYFDDKGSFLNPKIETHQFINKNGIHARYESKKFANGDRFELYQTPDEEIKFIRNRFGEIKSFKSSVPAHRNFQPHLIIERVRGLFESLNHNLLG